MLEQLLLTLGGIALGMLFIWTTSVEDRRAKAAAARRLREKAEQDRCWALERAALDAALHRNLDAIRHFLDAGYGATAGHAVPDAQTLARLPKKIPTHVTFNARERAATVPIATFLTGMRLVLTEAEAITSQEEAVALAQLPWSRVRVRPFHRGPPFPHCLVAHRPVKDAVVLRLDEDCKIAEIEALVNCDQDGENYGSWQHDSVLAQQ